MKTSKNSIKLISSCKPLGIQQYFILVVTSLSTGFEQLHVTRLSTYSLPSILNERIVSRLSTCFTGTSFLCVVGCSKLSSKPSLSVKICRVEDKGAKLPSPSSHLVGLNGEEQNVFSSCSHTCTHSLEYAIVTGWILCAQHIMALDTLSRKNLSDQKVHASPASPASPQVH